jgi:hypothetical protein
MFYVCGEAKPMAELPNWEYCGSGRMMDGEMYTDIYALDI